MNQRLPIVFVQVKARDTSVKLLNKIRQIIYSLYRTKEITKKAYKNIMNSIKISYANDTIFVNYENRKTSEPYRLLHNFADKINLKRSGQYVALSNPRMYYRCKNIKHSYQSNRITF